MSDKTANDKGLLPTPVAVVVGLLIMAGGWWLAKNPPESLASIYESLANSGIHVDFGKTISTIGVFIALFALMKSFYFQPLSDAIHARTSELESTFSEADKLRAEMTSLRNEYEARIAKTEADAREQIQSQVKEAQALAQQLRAEAAGQAEEMKRNASAEIAAERNKLTRELQLSVVNLTLQATEKLLDENVDTEKNRKLVEEFIAKVEAPR